VSKCVRWLLRYQPDRALCRDPSIDRTHTLFFPRPFALYRSVTIGPSQPADLHSFGLYCTLFGARALCRSTHTNRGKPHPKWDERPVAIVIISPGATITKDRVIEHCKSKVSAVVCVSGMLFVDLTSFFYPPLFSLRGSSSPTMFCSGRKSR